MEDLEENPEMRQYVNVYRKRATARRAEEAASSVADGGDVPQIALAEMLEDMDLGEGASASEVATAAVGE